jgi:hypothetical protein
MSALADIWPYVLLVLVGFLPNEIWRVLGMIAARGIAEDSELIVWVRAVATAILAGVVAKIVVFAPGALASAPLAVRLAAAALGVAVYVLIGRSVFAGVATGAVALVIGTVWLGG